MEFDELKKIWDIQNEKTMYAIDEQALHGIIKKKKRWAIKKAKLMEVFLTAANLMAGSTVLIAHTMKGSDNVYAYLMGLVMVTTALIILFFRSRRQSTQQKYQNTMFGDIEHGIAEARYVVQMSRTMQYYFAFIGILMLLAKGFDDWTSPLFVIIFVGFTLYASTWEHRWYVGKLKELKKLKNTLENEEELSS